VAYDWLPQALGALHGIEPREVLEALGAPRRWPVPATAAGMFVLGVWARTAGGRPLIVALRRVGDLEWLILGARDMDHDELATFEQWEAQ
jgi:hypothetical protein